ncbi:hypothetical protein BASA81_001567 [Batrachochytrium salamandrivorans]|nr:hypothetical protein BASA81_001567 [Batrachochytrium salamandrivorans]
MESVSKRVKASPSKYELTSPQAVAKGAYGSIYRAVERANPHSAKLAIKRIPALEDEVGIGATSLREISILKEATSHANIVKLLDVETDLDLNQISLVFEWMDCDLKTFLELQRPLSSSKRKFLMRQLTSGVHHIHSKSIFHRDLKPANVLIDTQTLQLKVADFGLGRRYTANRSYTRDVVSQYYRSPELLLGLREYTLAIDIWSLGCIFAELGLRGKHLFGGAACEFDQLLKIFRALGTPREMAAGCEYFDSITFPQWPTPVKFLGKTKLPLLEQSPEQELLKRCLELDHTKRISAKQAMEHEYFNV